MNIHYGDWRVVQTIGFGSFGTVYEIERESFGFRQRAALKVISIPQTQNEVETVRNTGMDENSISEYYSDLAAEILKELQTMEQLKGHSNIVSYEDHEIHPKEDGIGWNIFLRMELLTPLTKYISSRSMNRNEIIRLGIDLCRALERCESLNIIHRDIKPENIFISTQGDAKLGDFGIARTAEQTMSEMSKKGTYNYMAPEVFLGKPYGKTADIYSLGLVLYYLLNNNRGPFLPPYPQPIKFQDQEQAFIRRIKGERFPLPSQADVKLAGIIFRACKFYSAQRFSSAKDMRIALQSLVKEELGQVVPSVARLNDNNRHDNFNGSTVQKDNNGDKGTYIKELNSGKKAQLYNDSTVSLFMADSKEENNDEALSNIIEIKNSSKGQNDANTIQINNNGKKSVAYINQSDKKEQRRNRKKKLGIISIIVAVFGILLLVFLINNPSADNGVANEVQDETNINVDLEIPYKQLTLKNGQEGKIVIKANGYGEDYGIVVEYPDEGFRVEEDNVTHTSTGQDVFTYTVTPTLKNGQQQRHVELIVKAVAADDSEKEYNWKVITVDVFAKEEDTIDDTSFAMPYVVGEYFDDAFIILKEKGLKPVIEFSKYTKGTLRVTAQKPVSNCKVKEGDSVTIFVAGWTRRDISIKPDIEYMDLKVGETKAVHLNINGNYPEETVLNYRWSDNYIDVEWGDWIDNECEVFLTAKKPGDSLLVVFYMEANNDGIPLAGTYIFVNIKQ